jgi:hypothetical protein
VVGIPLTGVKLIVYVLSASVALLDWRIDTFFKIAGMLVYTVASFFLYLDTS